jgi:hypothetical protein
MLLLDDRSIIDLGETKKSIDISSFYYKESAIEKSNRLQMQLRESEMYNLVNLISKSIHYYYNEEEKVAKLSELTGIDVDSLSESISRIKDWGSKIEEFYQRSISGEFEYSQSRPIFVILPSKSEQVTPWMIIQAILSRNSIVLRTSNTEECMHSVVEFLSALRSAYQELRNDKLRNVLNSISIIRTESKDYLPQFCIDNWNYVIFGFSSYYAD